MRRLEDQLCAAVRKTVLNQPVRLPDAGHHLMQAFVRLSHARSWNAHAPNPISFQEIDAWCRLMHVPLRPIDVVIIRAMDGAFLDAWTHKRDMAKSEGVKTLPPVSQQPLSAALFDAVLG